MERPRTRYAHSGDVAIAYQVSGEGPLDIVFIPGFISHLDLAWENPLTAHVARRLQRFSRCTSFDKRGTGLSDRSIETASIEDRMDDIRAVMDAVEMEQACLIGLSEGGPMAILFAATYPERVSALVLGGTFAEPLVIPGLEDQLAWLEKHWGSGLSMQFFTAGTDQEFAARYERSSATPRMAAHILRMNTQMDVRAALPAIACPTLVTHRRGDPVVAFEYGRRLAEGIRDCRFIEKPGTTHLPATIEEWDEELDDVEEFLTGIRRAPEPDRVLATVLFTDIVGSTAQAAALGDRGWSERLGRHQHDLERLIGQFRGRMIKNTGDGVLALFDGPSRAVRCAEAIVTKAETLGLRVRAGLHTGEVELLGDDVAGIAVHLAQRVESLAGSGEVLVSQTVRDLLAGSGIELEDRGVQELKGIPGDWRLFAVR